MKAFDMPFSQLAEFEDMERDLIKKDGAISLGGLSDSQKIHMAYGLGRKFKNRIIATYSDQRVREIYDDYSSYDREVLTFPARDLIFFQADIHGNRLEMDRMKVIRSILEGGGITVITTFDALMTRQVPPDKVRRGVFTIREGDDIDLKELSKTLTISGYERLPQVESPGQFSVRGGIVDIFDLTSDNPVRIELWGDTADSIRSFDSLSQRSIESLKEVSIYPATEMVLTKEELESGIEEIVSEGMKVHKTLRDSFKTEEAHRLKLMVDELSENSRISRNMVNLEGYLPYFFKEECFLTDFFDSKETLVILDEPMRIGEHSRAVFAEYEESMKMRLEKGYALSGQAGLIRGFEETAAALRKGHRLLIHTIQGKEKELTARSSYTLNGQSVASYNNSIEALITDLKRFKREKYRTVLLTSSGTRAARLCGDLQDEGISAVFSRDPDKVPVEGELLITTGHLRKGFIYPLIKCAFLSENDIFGDRGHKKDKIRKKARDFKGIKSYDELEPGDYVVHESHGLGIYRGIEKKVSIEGITKDYMKVEYRGGSNLYVLASSFHVIQKYASRDSKPPKLNALGSPDWNNTRQKVRRAVQDMARELVELYAERAKGKGYSYLPDTQWQREFEETFPFEETGDQLAAIRDTKADMESSRIMDRLICGDVGFGKTEIAIRAAFKAVQEGKQVALLVPTTILAQQHYNTFVQRMKDFPVNICLLSRFRTPKSIKESIKGLKNGTVDIAIGTHRLLSKDVEYKDLGLLVVDEEQRFGVTHKEKIKTLKTNVDVLTLTATPIPRTLHMSLSGIRDMSILEEAPQERMPIQTFVCEYNEEMVREAIVRELSRDGQVYYVYNRVANIADIAARIGQMVPEASVAYAHGKMPERQLEEIMYDFIDGSVDVLVSTTIIETGLDIPNVNTMIIHDSDNMGLAQLYQLRGRIGRSSRTSYAFLMYKRDKMLREVAEKRLNAIREFTDLGSGFKIAMRDLEIRGAGNVLGKTQHGHMEAVGYELYCKMLNEAVREEKGLPAPADTGTAVDLDVDAFIPDEYILNEIQKLDSYKRIAGIENFEEYEDMREELKDRYGALPREAENLLRISMIRQDAGRVYVKDIKGKRGKLTLTFRPDAGIKVEKIPLLLEMYKNTLTFRAVEEPYLELTYQNTGIPERDGENLLLITEELLRYMKGVLI